MSWSRNSVLQFSIPTKLCATYPRCQLEGQKAEITKGWDQNNLLETVIGKKVKSNSNNINNKRYKKLSTEKSLNNKQYQTVLFAMLSPPEETPYSLERVPSSCVWQWYEVV